MEKEAVAPLHVPFRRTQNRLQALAADLGDHEQPLEHQPDHSEAIAGVVREWIIPALVQKFLADRSSTAPVTPVASGLGAVTSASFSRSRGKTRKQGVNISNVLSSLSGESDPSRLANLGARGSKAPASRRRAAEGLASSDNAQTPVKVQHPPRPELPSPGIRIPLPKSDRKSRLPELVQRGSGLIPPNNRCL
jgi:hypothetical protein